MTLYHGTNIKFSVIDLAKCLPYKDFGQGFYLTDILPQAERYQEGAYTLAEAVRELQFKKLNSQYCFCTERAIAHLTLSKQ